MISDLTKTEPYFSHPIIMQYRYIFSLVLLTVIYTLSAKLGLNFATIHGSVTLIWPPSGIALAVLLICGKPMWPGVFLGVFLVNFWISTNIAVSLSIACGNTFEALLGYWLVHKFIGQNNLITSLVNLYKFFIIALLSPIIAATIGPTALVLGGLSEWSSFSAIASTWWFGDTAGILIFTPLLLIWLGNFPTTKKTSLFYLEVFLFSVLLTLISAMAFNSWLPTQITDYPLAFVTFPFCTWAAYRYGFKGATLTILWVMSFAIYGTANEHGPFYSETLSQSLFQLQTFMTIIVITTLTLAAVITERYKIEKQLIAEKERAENLANAKSQFLSNMSHEFRTPLNAIIGFSQLLLAKHEFTDNQQESIRHIEEGGQHLLNLVNDLLEIAQTDKQKLDINVSQLRLHDSISNSIHFIEQAASQRKIQILYDSTVCTDLVVTADEIRLQQVLINLLSNATKYNRDGGSITITCHKTDLSIVIAITDTGQGIAAEDLPNLFEPFTRFGADNSAIEGTGIGLSITRKLVELMHGSIEVESNLGKGSTFRVKLPA